MQLINGFYWSHFGHEKKRDGPIITISLLPLENIETFNYKLILKSIV